MRKNPEKGSTGYLQNDRPVSARSFSSDTPRHEMLKHSILSSITPEYPKTLVLIEKPLVGSVVRFLRNQTHPVPIYRIKIKLSGGATTRSRKPKPLPDRALSEQGHAMVTGRVEKKTRVSRKPASRAPPPAPTPAQTPTQTPAPAEMVVQPVDLLMKKGYPKSNDSALDVHANPELYNVFLGAYMRKYSGFEVTEHLFELIINEFEDDFLNQMAKSSPLMKYTMGYKAGDVETKKIEKIRQSYMHKFLDKIKIREKRLADAKKQFLTRTRYIDMRRHPVEMLDQAQATQTEQIMAKINAMPSSGLATPYVVVGDIENFGTGKDFKGFRHIVMTPVDGVESDRQALGRIVRKCSLYGHANQWKVQRTMIVPGIAKTIGSTMSTCEELGFARSRLESSAYLKMLDVVNSVGWGRDAIKP